MKWKEVSTEEELGYAVYIGYDVVYFNEGVEFDLIELELIHDALLKAMKEVNKRIIKMAEKGDEE